MTKGRKELIWISIFGVLLVGGLILLIYFLTLRDIERCKPFLQLETLTQNEAILYAQYKCHNIG